MYMLCAILNLNLYKQLGSSASDGDKLQRFRIPGRADAVILVVI